MRRLLDQLGQLLAAIEHVGLHGRGRNAKDGRAIIDRLLVVVDEVDDLAVIGRELGQGAAQHLATVLLLKAISGLSALSATVASMVSSIRA